MKIEEIVETVKGSEAYRSWKERGNYVPAHVFKMLDDPSWQLGFFSEKGDDMVTFSLQDGRVLMSEPSEVFKKPGAVVSELDLGSVKIPWEDAVERAAKLQAEEYPKEIVFKRFFILQQIGEAIYNITLVTRAFNTINIRLSAKTGMVISHQKQSLLDLGEIKK